MKITDDTIDATGNLILSKNEYALDCTERTEAATHLTLTRFHFYMVHGDSRWKRGALWAAACFIYGWNVEAPRNALAASMTFCLYAIFGMQLHLFGEGLLRGSWGAAMALIGVIVGAFAVAIVSKKESWHHVT